MVPDALDSRRDLRPAAALDRQRGLVDDHLGGVEQQLALADLALRVDVAGQVGLVDLAHLAAEKADAEVERVLADRQRHDRLAEDGVVAENGRAGPAEHRIRFHDAVAEVDVVRARGAHAERVPVLDDLEAGVPGVDQHPELALARPAADNPPGRAEVVDAGRAADEELHRVEDVAAVRGRR